jgi:putative ABC transport system permease protein
MFKNYFSSAIRFFKRNKVFSIINFAGLTVALSASFIMLLYVINEYSYNHSFKNLNRIYRVIHFNDDFKKKDAGTPFPLSSTLEQEIPQILKAANARRTVLFIKLEVGELTSVGIGTESDFFEIFPLRFIYGQQDSNTLSERNSIVLTKSLSEKIFPGQNPIGKEINGSVTSNMNFIIKGVIEDIPENSTLKAEFFISNKWTLDPVNRNFKIQNADELWDKDFWTTYVLISKGIDINSIDGQINSLESKYLPDWLHNHYLFQKFSSVYLKSEDIQNSGIQGNMKSVRLYMVISLLILIVATINYIVLSTVVSSGRTKEIGIRKTFGANIGNIRFQLLSESISSSLLVLPFVIILMYFVLPHSQELFNTKLSFVTSNLLQYFILFIFLTAVVGISSGLYTSVYMSELKVNDILKNSFHTGKNRNHFRSTLIVIQLVLFCSFASGTLIIRSQYNYALGKDPGYFNSNVLLISPLPPDNRHAVLVENIKSIPNVISSSGIMDEIPMTGSATSIIPGYLDREKKIPVESFSADYNFIKTMGIQLVAGRDFSKEYGGDMTQSIILNETAVKDLEIPDPLGKIVLGKTILGVVKDFNIHSIHSEIPPLEISLTDQYIRTIAVHYSPGTLSDILPLVEQEWKKIYKIPFRYRSIEDVISGLYSKEKKLNSIILILTILILAISTFGLFGLTLFIARTRVKEVGIRKIFGSAEKQIIFLSLKGYLILVLIAAVISIPLTLFFIRNWLSNFAFKVHINWWIFLITAIIAGSIVFLTLISHSVKISRVNPLNAIKYE